MAWGGVKEGLRMGSKMGFWTCSFFALEDAWDDIRGKKDFVNTVLASLTVAGGFSLWSKTVAILSRFHPDHVADLTFADRFPVTTAARTAKTGLTIGLAFGLAQDGLAYLRGRRPAYIDYLLRRSRRQESGDATPNLT
jgi:hypothetical protein